MPDTVKSERSPAFEPGTRVAVLGLGVSGEAAAVLSARRGGEVYASDVSDDPGPRAAAERLQALGIDAETGGHDLSRILECELVIVSPGIGPATDVRREIQAAGIRTIAEVELAWHDLESASIAITGTNGKTTTTGLVAHILAAAGLSAAAAGNIGRPLSDIVLSTPQPEWVAVELSSFQLADQETLDPDVGVLLNLSPDHLDRYADVESYYADKRRLFANARPTSQWVLNADDPGTSDLAEGVAGRRFHFSLSVRPDRGSWIDDEGTLRCTLPERGEEAWVSADELRLIGPHNVANALAAGLACALAGIPAQGIREGMRSFEPLPHRLQPLGELDGVLWVNDSKATNVTATGVAVRSFERPVVLILGGRHKGEPYTGLTADPESRVRGIVAYGEAAPRIVSDLSSSVRTLRVESGLEAVVRAAAELSEPGDVVLLSPACSSYDMFPNYIERGKAFERAFRELATRAGSVA